MPPAEPSCGFVIETGASTNAAGLARTAVDEPILPDV